MIRAATLQDVPAIADLFYESMPSPWTRADIEGALRLPTMVVWVWTEAGCIQGALLLQRCMDEAEILSIATAPKLRRRGIGRALLTYALTEIGRETSVFLEVRSQNLSAIAFYKALGFREIGMRKKYYRDPPDDALVMKFGKF